MAGPDDPTLESILEGCRRGDPLAWELLVRRYQARVYGLARTYVPDPEDARDLAQEVFLRIYRKLSTCPPAAEFLPWMLAVTRNACIDHLRGRRCRPGGVADSPPAVFETLQDPAPGPEESCERSLLKNRIRRALHHLTALNREILVLKDIQGLTLEEIAGLLRVPLGTLKSRAHRARLELAGVLAGMGVQSGARRED